MQIIRHIAVSAGLLVVAAASPALLAQTPADPVAEDRYVAEIDAIRQDDRVDVALRHILSLEPRHREELIELTEIPAPPFKRTRGPLRRDAAGSRAR